MSFGFSHKPGTNIQTYDRHNTDTVDPEIFALNIFRLLIFRVVLFSSFEHSDEN